jgi:hypothetical protein
MTGTANAPAGAMQFEITDPDLLVHSIPFIWVYPKRKDSFVQRRCNCKQVFPVVVELLPEMLKKLALAEMQDEQAKDVGVCECSGKIIE